MLISVECKFCDGLGRIHSPGCNGDPADDGVQCTYCGGAGCVDTDINDDADDED